MRKAAGSAAVAADSAAPATADSAPAAGSASVGDSAAVAAGSAAGSASVGGSAATAGCAAGSAGVGGPAAGSAAVGGYTVGFAAVGGYAVGFAAGSTTAWVVLELRKLSRQPLKRCTLRSGLRIGIAGAGWLTGVWPALVHCWRSHSAPRIGDAGRYDRRRKLGCGAGLIRHDRDAALSRAPISEQGYLVVRWAAIGSCHRARLDTKRALDGPRVMAIRRCRGDGVVTRRWRRGRAGGRIRRKEWQCEPHHKGNASKERYPDHHISAGPSWPRRAGPRGVYRGPPQRLISPSRRSGR